MQTSPDNNSANTGYAFLSDPLQLSSKDSLPFPEKAASRLAEQRSSRYDEVFFALEDADLKIRELASIMGMLPNDDDLPTAA
jgi:hypothetical protein